MKIIEPKVELWLQDDPIAHVAKCARVCYGNKEGKSTDQQLYDNLLKAKHNSMFRHESVYAVVPLKEENGEDNTSIVYDIVKHYNHNPYIDYNSDGRNCYIATNKNFMIDAKPVIRELIKMHQVSPKEFENASEVAWNMMRYTFHITTQISTSRELNRVSPNNIAEKSTRYCVEDGAIVRPHWLNQSIVDEYNEGRGVYSDDTGIYYLLGCEDAFKRYKQLIDLGMKRQDARGVLPLDTATEVVYTYSIDEWRHIIELRSSKRAHPNAQIIANMIKKELEELGYDF